MLPVRFAPFVRLRRRARRVLGPVLPALVVSWVAAAGPCMGMVAAEVERPGAHAERRAGHHGETLHRAGGAEPAHSHGACPHCPGSTGATTDTHARCSSLDDVSDGKRRPNLSAHVETAPVGVVAVDVVSSATPAAARPPDSDYRVLRPSVPLNLRHCVLII